METEQEQNEVKEENSSNKSVRSRRSSSAPCQNEAKQSDVGPRHVPLKKRNKERSKSPQKSFSYLSNDGMNHRLWKERRREASRIQENERIFRENQQILQRLANIAKQPSSYPSIHLEQERLRERHTVDFRRKVIKGYIPILRENLSIVNRLATVKGVYDREKFENDYRRHLEFLRWDAENRQKNRQFELTHRPFTLPKIKHRDD